MFAFNFRNANDFELVQWQNQDLEFKDTTELQDQLRLKPLSNAPFDILSPIADDLGSEATISVDTITTSSEHVSIQEDTEEEDIWTCNQSTPSTYNTLSWDTHNTHYPSYAQTKLASRGIGTPFLTEAPLSFFEPLLSRSNTVVIHQIDLVKSLVQAVAGLPSIYFYWDTGKLKQHAQIRTLGVTRTAIAPVLEQVLLFGSRLRALDHVAQQCQSNPHRYGLVGVAFGCCLAELHINMQYSIVSTLENATTVLQVHQYIQNLEVLVERMCQLLKVRQGNQFTVPFGAQLLNLLQQEIIRFDLALSGNSALYRDICLAMLSYTSVPYLNMLSCWLRLSCSDDEHNQDPYQEFFIDHQASLKEDVLNRFQIRPNVVLPYFISNELALYILRSGISLQLLKRSKLDHPLFHLNSSLSLKYTLEISKAEEYMDRLQEIRSRIQAFNAGAEVELEISTEQEPPPQEEEDTPMIDLPTLPLLGGKPDLAGDFSNTLNHILRHHTQSNSSYIPTLDTITSLSCIKPLQVWCSLLNECFMSTFLDQFKLQSHLSLLYRYFLFGHGIFVQGLRTVFFPKETIGLDIQGSWPPKTFHLNMVLRDVMLEAAEQKEDDLVTFHIRKTSDTSVWNNPNAVEALDFLKLEYQANYPLNMVITPSILDKYNRVFVFLVRLLRASTVAKRIYQPLRGLAWFRPQTRDKLFRYRFQMQQFMSALESYVHDTAIHGTWISFMQHVTDMHQSQPPHTKDSLDYVSVIMEPHTFRDYHEHILDCILFQCFLKQSQTRILQLLLPILHDVVLMGAIVDDYVQNTDKTLEQEDKLGIKCRKMFEQFQQNTKFFVRILVMLESKGSGRLSNILNSRSYSIFNELYGKHEAKRGPDVFVKDLLTRLSLNGFYEQPE